MIDFSELDPKDCHMVNPIEGTHSDGWADISPYNSWDSDKSSDHWIITENGCVITCPKCGERLELCYPDGTEVRYLPYCPWCGKKLDK